MSISSAHADAFYSEIREHGEVWTIRDSKGIPAPQNKDGQRAMPFWSLESRAARIIANAPAYREFKPFRIQLEEWTTKWLPGMEKDSLLVGLNWSGSGATGYDLQPSEVTARLKIEKK